MSDTVVSAEHLCKTYGSGETKIAAIRDVSFTIRSGEFVSVMGPSGCGKSTLLYLIGGLDTPTSGRVLTCGCELAAMDDTAQSRIRCSRIGFVFQFYNLVQNLTVEENILLPMVMAGKSVAHCAPRLEELLKMTGLTEKRGQIPSRLSGGQQQLVSIARAVISEPQLILADEPTGNLDSRSGAEILRNFQSINRELGISIIMVTHSDEAAACSGRVLRMQDGMLVDDGLGPEEDAHG